LFDEITALSAPGSRVATEVFGNTPDVDAAKAEQSMQDFAQRWRDHGLDVDLSDLWYHEDRNDVVSYLDARGWASVGATIQQLLEINGLSPARFGASVPASVYYTSILAS
jgi:O-methyltransferase involved in polyketide biosynthesis